MSLVLLSKVIVTIGMVLSLSAVAERVSPRVAGLLSGYPLGAAIALFFMGLELGPDFAAQSAVYTPVGLVASQVFVYAYYRASTALQRRVIPSASLAALGGYFAAAWLLHLIPFSPTAAVLVPVASIFVFTRLFRKIPNVAIARSVRFTFVVLLLRAGLAAITILVITGAARAVGPAWAGLFAAFPTTLFPLLLIVHITYDKAHVHTIIKNFPLGLGALIAYAVAVSLLYPPLGIYGGTLVAFSVATLYLLVYGVVVGRLRRARTGRN
jgi:hypothetical protein